MRFIFRATSLIVALASLSPAMAGVKVVATLPSYASIAGIVGGDRVETFAISRPDEDAHFVKPKPSLALMLKDADLFVTTGLDLELWAPTLVDKSGNRRIRDGELGFVAAAEGVRMLEVPANPSRAAGDIHVYGNPHIHTSPINAKVIATNIVAGLIRVDPDGAEIYEANLKVFRHRIDVALYGEKLVNLLGSDVLDPLAEKSTLIPFLENKTYEGRPLSERLGGWFARARSLRGKRIIAYHKNWIYLATLLGIEIADYVEPKPGIPPSARHVHELIRKIQGEGIRVLLSATYFDPAKPRAIAERTGCTVVRAPLQPGGDEAGDYLQMMDLWVSRLLDASGAGAS
jgi:ABC-type Zn uptake system ZnuABC Zn-binding protein ZnuA